jgi:spermidine/putrescine transport system ATP-binding protein
MSEPLVVFDKVFKRYGPHVAVKGIDLEIRQGEFLAIMGPSGCGKTTTLRMLAGLEDPSEGDIRLNGKSLVGVAPNERDTPLVWQSLALFPFLNARENVEFGLKMRKIDAATRRRKALDWLDRLGIAEFAERDVERLSGGQRQRVALARALVTEPRILLLDEPLSALDAHLVIRMQAVLTKLQRELGITFVYVTHSQSEAFAMADRIVIMAQGSIAQVGAAREIYRTPVNRFVAEFVGRNNIFSGVSKGGGRIETPAGPLRIGVAAPEGETVTFSVAADLMTFAPDASAAAPGDGMAIEAQFLSEEFVGSMVTLFFETSDGAEIKVQLPERSLSDFTGTPGRSFRLTFDPHHAHVLKD